MAKADETRARLLDAAERVLLARGQSNFTLDAVAAEAGVSKGGLLYHFASKEALLVGLVRRVADRSAAIIAGERSVARWYIQYPDDNDEAEAALIGSVIASLRSTNHEDDAVHREVTALMTAWDGAIKAEVGGDSVRAAMIRLVGDGIFLATLMKLPLPDPEVHRQLVARLLDPQP